MEDIQSRAPPLNPEGRRLPGLKNQGKKKKVIDPVLQQKERKIEALIQEIRRCDAIMAKTERDELRKKRARVKLIDPESEKALVERIFYTEIARRRESRERQLRQHIPQQERTFLSASELENTVYRVHTEALMRKEEAVERIRAQCLPSPTKSPTLGRNDIVDLGNRLSTNEVESRKAAQSLLVKKYSAPARAKLVLNAEQVLNTNNRLYADSLKRKAEVMGKLQREYTPEPAKVKLTKEQQAAVNTRLCSPQS